MSKLYRLAISNIRKSKGQSASFLLIILFAAILLNLGIVTAIDYSGNFDKKSEELNSPDIVYVVQNNEEAVIRDFKQILESDSRTEQIENRSILIAAGDFNYGGGAQSRTTVFFSREDHTELGKWSIVEEAKNKVEHPVYLPWLFYTGGNYQLNDTFEIQLYTANSEKLKFTYTVAGFYEDIYFSTLNNSMTGFLLEEKDYRELEEAFGGTISGIQYSVKLSDYDGDGFASQYYSVLKSKISDNLVSQSSSYPVLKSARTITSSIGAMIIISFSVIVLIISLVLIKFRIANSIDEEMRNIGALKAIGYTGNQMIGVFLVQFLMLALAGTMLGILLAYLLLPGLSMLFSAQTGIVWQQKFSYQAMLLTITIILFSVIFVALFTAKRVKKLPPIIALRSGVLTHNFRRNRFPLENSKGSLTWIMAGKQFLCNLKQNISIGFIVLGVTFLAVFASALYYNIKVEDNIFLNLVSGKIENVILVAPTEDAAEQLLLEVLEEKEVEHAYFFGTDMVSAGQYETLCYISDDYDKNKNQNWLYKGRFPKYENEAAIGGQLAKQLGKKIGDTIPVMVKDTEKEFLITGLIQGSNYLGLDICLTIKGYQSINSEAFESTITVCLRDGESAADFIQTMEQKSENIIASINSDENIRTSMGIYKMIIGILAMVIGLISIIIIGLVLYLVIKTLLIRQKQELAIKKAIGFTTTMLAFQNACAFLPVIITGTALGCICGKLWLNQVLSILFSSIGIMKVNFIIPAGILIGILAIIIVTGFFISFVVSMRIRKITPYSLLSE